MKRQETLSADEAKSDSQISVSITNRFGQRFRYRAQDVTLNLRQGDLHVVEREYGCFVRFDHCDIEVADSEGTAIFQLSNPHSGEENGRSGLTIVAALKPNPAEAASGV